MSVSTYLLYGGAALFIAAFWRTAWLTLCQNGLELAGILLFLFGLQFKRKFGSADTIVILTLMLLNGFYFGSKVLFLAACIFLLLHWTKGPAAKAAFLPSLTAGYVCLVLFNQILRL
ncbi:hypothetical protein LFYK43_18440 [Ligilactobacillus salitolerans]|uniref:Uncharacterized protein n=2 Tax=Ligilactobacillus salitolerans TaxID=1808352 RepID=A0A401IV53_9LACO|nr:hypothetical protein LFYK43_18440 [Ligilactobacillus salitolerans]